MKTITHLVYVEAESVCDIEAGTFLYLDATGNETAATFFVRTCAEENSARRVDDYNEQYCDMYTRLQLDGATRIRYTEKIPNAIF